MRLMQIEARRREIARIDADSRTRALTERESRRLQALLLRERYDAHRVACLSHAACWRGRAVLSHSSPS